MNEWSQHNIDRLINAIESIMPTSYPIVDKKNQFDMKEIEDADDGSDNALADLWEDMYHQIQKELVAEREETIIALNHQKRVTEAFDQLKKDYHDLNQALIAQRKIAAIAQAKEAE